ncbi:MAG: hypothetical protein GVY23_08590 [Spirochaetes bacterium]|jgi:hypothetical protein|nr:hypothetical protein [Spirochaetota bacterium]
MTQFVAHGHDLFRRAWTDEYGILRTGHGPPVAPVFVLTEHAERRKPLAIDVRTTVDHRVHREFRGNRCINGKKEWYGAVGDYLQQVGFPELPESARV